MDFQIGVEVDHLQGVSLEGRLSAQLGGKEGLLHLADPFHGLVDATSAVAGNVILHAGAHGASDLVSQQTKELVQHEIIIAEKLAELRLIVASQGRTDERVLQLPLNGRARRRRVGGEIVSRSGHRQGQHIRNIRPGLLLELLDVRRFIRDGIQRIHYRSRGGIDFAMRVGQL